MDDAVKYRDPRWRPIDWIALGMALAAATLLTLRMMFPSSYFMNQASMTIDREEGRGWVMTSVRDMPRGAVWASWRMEITVLDRPEPRRFSGPAVLKCHHEEQELFVPFAGGLTKDQIGLWAWPCLDAGPPLYVHYQWQVVLLGRIWLRPSEYSFTISPALATQQSGG